ncbi:Peptidase S24-like protein [Flavobacterium psychrophilum]|uniref:S24 family peptidase n=1 Tax=Flavobacterium psychrophilum TaxID=96345 RepID=UPI000B7C38CF|nr:S24 family peptidase [Flavobacterium psychrophilum]ELV7524966.1 helix-turn-helix transcriptional regulator [Flavobacterium psychrophilum]MCB6097217.1 helix-turn-helix transcriptional regulator [Flavobacterium psychrophilum]SNA79023.1 Peptidase S24-like protein [Flavobacterium psychrophilum]SNB06551.1 Peptidase S24-like protein [Flavobacterium psychrophilum]SNB12392.1 Peptidase S24-like protein [Flavobacterium psychrophilum]
MMNNILNINERISHLIENQYNDNQKKFAESIGYSAQVVFNIVSGRKSSPSFDVLNAIISTNDDVNSEWLLTGKGSMLKTSKKFDRAENAISELKYEVKDLLENYTVSKPKEGIPLIPIEAMAGYGGGETQVLELDCEYFSVPTFKGADFLIQVKGSSMYPKYNSGDIVACKKLQLNDLFFQWNKVYVLDTEQGAIIKRIDIGPDDDHVMIVSDNEKYRPFSLHKSKINAISIVMGVIRLE